jgi:hypothetical protein
MLAVALETRLAGTQEVSPVDSCASARFGASHGSSTCRLLWDGFAADFRNGCPANAGWFELVDGRTTNVVGLLDETLVDLKPDCRVTSSSPGLWVFFSRRSHDHFLKGMTSRRCWIC